MIAIPELAPAPHIGALVLAGPQPGNDTGGHGEDWGKASPVALVVLVLLFIAVALLIRSMTKHLKKVPVSFDPEERARLEAEAAKAAESGEPKSKPVNSIRAKALARAEAQDKSTGRQNASTE